MRNYLVVPVLLFLVLGISCTSLGSSKVPSWIDHPYDKAYDEDTYLCAVGSGSSRQKAVDAALASLSQVFNAQVRSVTEVSSLSTAATDTMGNVTFTESSEMMDFGSVTSETDQIIGSEVVNVYTDELGRVHARVALHRERTASLYQKQIAELGSSIAQLNMRSATADTLLAEYVLLRETRELAKQQQALYNQLQVLLKQPQRQVLAPIDRALSALAQQITIAVEVFESVNATPVLKAAFEQGLQERGFSTGAQDPYAILDVWYTVEPITMEGSPYAYARYTLSIQLKDSKQVYVSYEKADREAAMSERDALAKALKAASSSGVDGFFTLMLETLGDET
nr:LPP20 family lipoprotein [uncultured Sphaerochaeta sp.]